MKTNLVAILPLCLILLTGCQKEPPEETAQPAIATKILGKWMLVKHSEETFHPNNTVKYSTERVGDASDSVIFRKDGKLLIYSNTDGNYIEDYQLLNGHTIRIEQENWTISLLSDTGLHLISEETDVTTKERDVAKAHFKRP